MKKTLCFIPLISGLAVAGTSQFAILGANPKGSQAYGISADGSTVLGYTWYGEGSSAIQVPCYWGRDGTIHYIVDPSTAYTGGSAYASNQDGSVIVGNAGAPGLQLNSFRLVKSQGLTYLPSLVAYRDSKASAISENGMIAGNVGGDSLYAVTLSPGNETFSWSPDNGIHDISKYWSMPGFTFAASKAFSISADGSVIAGCFLSGPFGVETSTIAGYYKDSQWFPLDLSFAVGSVAYVVTADGQYFGGKDHGFGFRKNINSATERLFPGLVTALSADGQIAVGGTGNGQAVVWTKGRGAVSLTSLVKDSFGGELPPDFQCLEMATGISADGSTIVGYTSKTVEVNFHPVTTKQAFMITNLMLLTDDCPADFDKSGNVDDSDFVEFLVTYNNLLCPDALNDPSCRSDINVDGLVDDSDFQLFIVAYDRLQCN